jgi:hypothetical protein
MGVWGWWVDLRVRASRGRSEWKPRAGRRLVGGGRRGSSLDRGGFKLDLGAGSTCVSVAGPTPSLTLSPAQLRQSGRERERGLVDTSKKKRLPFWVIDRSSRSKSGA